MARWFHVLFLAAGIMFFSFGCDNDLPELPDAAGLEDGATHDVVPRPDLPESDWGLRPDRGPGPDSFEFCSENSDCPGMSFCRFNQGCEGPAHCEPPPVGCYDVYEPVCGCDNQSYGNACEAHMAGVSVSHEGVCHDPGACTELDVQYGQLLEQAKICVDAGVPDHECSREIPDALFCGCPTYITEVHQDVLAEIEELWVKWDDLGCTLPGGDVCPSCQSPNGAFCDTTTGMCVDNQ